MSAAENPNPVPTPLPVENTDHLLPAQTERVLPETVAKWAWSLGTVQAEAEELFSFLYERTREASSALVTPLRQRARRLRDEQPVQLLGIIGLSTFAIGFGAALWKSNR